MSDEIILGDRAVETSLTHGTGTYTLEGAIATTIEYGKVLTIADAVGDGRRTYYGVFQEEDFEIGIGRAHKGTGGSPDTLERLVIKRSTRPGNAAVPWGSGTRTIFTTTPAGSIALVDNALAEYAAVGAAACGNIGAARASLVLHTANALSELAGAAGTARGHLGIGTAGVLNVGVGAGNVIQLDGSSRIPAVSGALLTALPASILSSLTASLTGGASSKIVRFSAAGAVTTASRSDSAAQLSWLFARGSDGLLYRPNSWVPFAGVAAGSRYFLSTSGDLTTTAPAPDGVNTQILVGLGVDTNVLYFRPHPPVGGDTGFGVALKLEGGNLKV